MKYNFNLWSLLAILSFLFGYTGNVIAQESAEIDQDKKAMVLRMGEFAWLDPAKPTEDRMAELKEVIKAKVAETATISKRFKVLDDEVAKDLNAYLQSEAFMNLSNEELHQITTDLMNDYSLTGEITKCKFTKRTTGAKGYTCLLTLKLTVFNSRDDANGEAVASRSFVSDFKNMIVRNTSDAALDDALQSMTQKMVDFFANNFSIYGTLLKYDGNEVIISCGKDQGIEKGNEFQVLSVIVAKGTKPQTTHVGKIKVKELLADGTSVCSISDGKDGIMERFRNASNTNWLQCKLILK